MSTAGAIAKLKWNSDGYVAIYNDVRRTTTVLKLRASMWKSLTLRRARSAFQTQRLRFSLPPLPFELPEPRLFSTFLTYGGKSSASV